MAEFWEGLGVLDATATDDAPDWLHGLGKLDAQPKPTLPIAPPAIPPQATPDWNPDGGDTLLSGKTSAPIDQSGDQLLGASFAKYAAADPGIVAGGVAQGGVNLAKNLGNIGLTAAAETLAPEREKPTPEEIGILEQRVARAKQAAAAGDEAAKSWLAPNEAHLADLKQKLATWGSQEYPQQQTLGTAYDAVKDTRQRFTDSMTGAAQTLAGGEKDVPGGELIGKSVAMLTELAPTALAPGGPLAYVAANSVSQSLENADRRGITGPQKYNTAIAHGAIDAAAMELGGKVIGASLPKLLGMGAEQEGKTITDQVVKSITERFSLAPATQKLAAVTADSAGQVVLGVGTEAAHYLTSVAAGDEPFDAGELQRRLIAAAKLQLGVGFLSAGLDSALREMTGTIAKRNGLATIAADPEAAAGLVDKAQSGEPVTRADIAKAGVSTASSVGTSAGERAQFAKAAWATLEEFKASQAKLRGTANVRDVRMAESPTTEFTPTQESEVIQSGRQEQIQGQGESQSPGQGPSQSGEGQDAGRQQENLLTPPEAPAGPREAATKVTGELPPAPEGQPVAPGFVRFYHGGDIGDGKRWFSPDQAYAEGYARKSGAPVSYVDVPESSPLLKKAFDDTGTNTPAPYVAFEAPEELASQAKPLPQLPPTPPENAQSQPEPTVLGFGGNPARKTVDPQPSEPPQTPEPVKTGLYGDRGFLGQDVVPKATLAARAVAEAVDTFKKFFAPQTRGEAAATTAMATREMAATQARKLAVAQEELRVSSKFFDLRPAEENLAFIDRLERGKGQPTPEETKAAATMRRMLDDARTEVQNLGTGKLQHWIENYFPHLWQDPAKASDVVRSILGKRPLEGAKGFLKQRSIPTTADGIERGLKPVSTNPVDLTMLKLREMYKYIGAHQLLENELKPRDYAVFVPAMQRAPDGFAKYDDKMFTVFAPPTIAMSEYVNAQVYNKLEDVATALGVRHDRLVDAGRGRLGFSEQGGNRVVTQNATGLSVLAHEIGHQLDHKYGLLEQFGLADRGRGGKLAQELRNISDMRFEGKSPDEVSAYARSYTRKGVEKIAQMVEAYVHAPEKMQEVAPNVYAKFKAFIESHAELAPLNDIKPSLAMKELNFEKPHGGLLTMGHYYGPEAATRVVNNYLSPGLREKSIAFRGALSIGNSMNMAQLGISAFHAGFTSMDAATSRLALGIEQAVHGESEALRTAASAAGAPVTNVIHGLKVRNEYLRPGSMGGEIGKIVDALVAGGGRAKQDEFYAAGMAKNFKEAIRQGNYTGATLRLPFATLEKFASPIMEQLVPLQKLGVFHDMMKAELDRNPNMSHDELRTVATKAWDSVDNRLGQMVYDNTFMHKAMKDLAFATVRSVGWNLGTLRELGGGLADTAKQGFKLARFQTPELTHRMAYVAALPILTGIAGATAQYLATGQAPQELKDYFYPKTGGKDQYGHDERVSLPTYLKDIYALTHDPGKTISHKLSPLIDTVSDMLQNEDFYGTKIRNEDDPLVQQVADELKFVGKQFNPFAVQGLMRLRSEGATPAKQALPFIGVMPAPASINKTAAEQKAQDLAGAQIPSGARTKEQAARTDAKRSLAKKIALSGPAGASPEVEQAIQGGTLQPKDVKDLVENAGKPQLERSLKSLPAEDAVKVYRLANDDEKARIYSTVYGKIERSSNLSEDAKAAYVKELGAPPEGVTPPTVKPAPDAIGKEAFDVTAPAPLRRLGEKSNAYRQRVADHAASTSKAQATLTALGATDPAALRKALIAEQKRRGQPTAVTDDAGNLTAFGKRLARLRVSKAETRAAQLTQ